MATWDVFHSDRLEVERSLSTAAVRAALARGDLRDDDLARPAGTNVPWARLVDLPALLGGAVPSDDEPELPETATDELKMPYEVTPEPPEATEAPADTGPGDLHSLVGNESEVVGESYRTSALGDDEELSEFDIDLDPESRLALPVESIPSHVQGWDRLAELDVEAEEAEFDPQEEDEDAAEFTLARGAVGRVEELDLAAMVDVAFQMVLFFMVTATTILFKTLEVPRTPPQDAPSAVAQGQAKKTLDDLKDDFIVVEIDPQGNIRVDHDPAAPETLVARLRAARTATGRTSMLLSADMSTPHRNAVLAYDAANEIGLKIAIAKPAAPSVTEAPAPSVTPRKTRAG